jgi:hypothetical protein
MLGFALGGALEGGGKGGAEAVAQQMRQQREEALVRLRADYESQRQQAGFGEEEKMQGIQHEQAVAAAGATRTFEEKKQATELTSKEKIAEQHETAATARAERLAESRENVADKRAAAQKETAKKAPIWSYRTLTEQGAPDGKGGFLPGRSYTQMMHNPSGRSFVQVGGTVDPKTGMPTGGVLLEHGANDTTIPDSSRIARPPVAEQNYLMQHPELWNDYLDRWHQLPTSILPAMTQQSQQQPSASNLPKFAPSGTKATPYQSVGGSNEVVTDNAMEDARADTEDAEAAGGEAEQDTAPAREPGQ